MAWYVIVAKILNIICQIVWLYLCVQMCVRFFVVSPCFSSYYIIHLFSTNIRDYYYKWRCELRDVTINDHFHLFINCTHSHARNLADGAIQLNLTECVKVFWGVIHVRVCILSHSPVASIHFLYFLIDTVSKSINSSNVVIGPNNSKRWINWINSAHRKTHAFHCTSLCRALFGVWIFGHGVCLFEYIWSSVAVILNFLCCCCCWCNSKFILAIICLLQ